MKEQEKIKRRLRTVSAKVKDNSDLADKNRADNYFDHTFLLRYYSNWVNINGRVKNAAVECIEHIVLDFVAQAYLTLLEFPSFKALGVGAMKMPNDGDDRRMSSELTRVTKPARVLGLAGTGNTGTRHGGYGYGYRFFTTRSR